MKRALALGLAVFVLPCGALAGPSPMEKRACKHLMVLYPTPRMIVETPARRVECPRGDTRFGAVVVTFKDDKVFRSWALPGQYYRALKPNTD